MSGENIHHHRITQINNISKRMKKNLKQQQQKQKVREKAGYAIVPDVFVCGNYFLSDDAYFFSKFSNNIVLQLLML